MKENLGIKILKDIDVNFVHKINDVSSTGVVNKVVKLDSAGDINVRLLKSTYANQATISGAIAFRTNNSTDNYTRYCSDVAAIRSFIGAAPTSHNHTALTSVTKITGAGASGSWGSIDIGGTKGSWAGINFSDYAYTWMLKSDGYSGLWKTGGSCIYAFDASGSLAVGTVPWGSVTGKPSTYYTHPSDANTRHVTDTEKSNWNGKAAASHTHSYIPLSGGTVTGALTVNSTINGTNVQVGGANVYHTGRKPSLTDLGAAAASHSHSNYITHDGTNTGWYRSTGAQGWFNSTYGGGINMTDTTWVKVYGNKSFLCDNLIKSVHLETTTINGYKISANYVGVNTIPVIGPNSVVEIGEFLDFHTTKESAGVDYSIRLSGDSGSLKQFSLSDSANWYGFYRNDNFRYGYIGKGSTANDSLYVVSEHSLILHSVTGNIESLSNIIPAADRAKWLGTAARRWKGVYCEGGTIGASDAIYKENMMRLNGDKIVLANDKIKTIKTRKKSNIKKATSTDYYNFFKDRFNPTYYNYKIDDEKRPNLLDKEEELRMLKNIGFLAQDYDIENDLVAKEFIFASENGGLSYNHMSYVTSGLIALQEAIKEIELLKEQNIMLMSKLN